MSRARVILKPLVSLLRYCGHAEDCLNCTSPSQSFWGQDAAWTPQHLHLEPLLLSTHTVHWSSEDLYKAYSTYSTSKESFHRRIGTFMTPFCYIKGTRLRIFTICADDFLLLCLLGVKQTTYFYMALKTSLKAPENQLQQAVFCYQQQNRGRLQHLWFYLEQLCNCYNCRLTGKEISLACSNSVQQSERTDKCDHLTVIHIKEVCNCNGDSLT